MACSPITGEDIFCDNGVGIGRFPGGFADLGDTDEFDAAEGLTQRTREPAGTANDNLLRWPPAFSVPHRNGSLVEARFRDQFVDRHFGECDRRNDQAQQDEQTGASIHRHHRW